ncbi:MAG TPA: type VI secretion system tip protein TssI/VgrG [Caulobacteraceae bacterium]|nr:type VI secretion system tip protein TssI/VgrG [Caulobacteraceae bacterium]
MPATSGSLSDLATVEMDLPAGVSADLKVEGLKCVESLNEPYLVLLDLFVPKAAAGQPEAAFQKPLRIDFSSVLGRLVKVHVEPSQALAAAGGGKNHVREFNGLLFEAEETGEDGYGVRYRLTLRPWLSLLEANKNSRIFADKTVQQILQLLFEENGAAQDAAAKAGFSFSLQNEMPARPYCVQYRESDFDFVSRLMEEYGIAYYFEHTKTGHVMHMVDTTSGHGSAPSIEYVPIGNVRGFSPEPCLWRWDEHVAPGAGKVTLRDYEFRLSDNRDDATKSEDGKTPHDAAEIYDFPAGHRRVDTADQVGLGTTLAKVRLEAARARRRRFVGEGDAFVIASGKRFTLKGHEEGRYNQEYLVLSATYVLSGRSVTAGAGQESQHAVTIEAIPTDVTWRPQLKTPRPVVGGPHVAFIVGTDDEKEILTDQYGRVLARFPWERQGFNTCWLRVSESWAGAEVGSFMLPRVGQEVLIDFMEGDPDQPIITGRVYNAQSTHPQTPVENKTRSYIRTRTAYGESRSNDYDGAVAQPDQSGPGYNEIMFEDKSGKEVVALRAQRDMTVDIRRDETRTLQRDQTETIGRNRTSLIQTGDETHTVDKGKRTEIVEGDDTLTVRTGDSALTVKSGNLSRTVSQGNMSAAVSVGDYSLKCDAGQITLEAATSITLKCGASKVTLTPEGVSIEGTMIKAEATAQLSTKAGAMAQHDGGPMMVIKGAMTMIN